MNRAFLLLATAAGVCGLAGCASPGSSADQQPACCRPLPNSRASTKSVYEPGSTWETDAGTRINLGDLAGRPRVAAMFYSSCHVACPLTLERMKEVERSLPRDLRAQVGFVLITFDPAEDTPAVLRSFRKTHQLSGDWTLLRGAAAETKSLAAGFGISFERESYRLAHSSGIVLLDAAGRVIFRLDGLHTPVRGLVAALEATAPKVVAESP